MSRICPETGEKVVYLACQECDDRLLCLSKSKQQIARELGGVKAAVQAKPLEYCNVHLTEEHLMDESLPLSYEYGNIDYYSFVTDCGNRINYQSGDRYLNTRRFVDNEGKPWHCQKCGRSLKYDPDKGTETTERN